MPLLALLMLVAAAQAEPRPIVVTGRGGIPFISPMGEPFRARSVGEDTLARWFYQADRNHDGFLTPDEMQADAERFFPEIDADHDGEIDPDEIVRYEWQVAPEIQVNAKLRRARTPAEQAAFEKQDSKRAEDEGGRDQRRGSHGRDYQMEQGPQGAGRYALLNMPEPVAAADSDFNRSITLAEFKAAAVARFQILDTKHQGRLSLQELEAMKPVLSQPGKKEKRRKEDEADTRVGIPLPPEPSVPSS